ncbi:inositol monophosphatase family protein [Exiguobacterium oxidotolerans]|uniref:inositol monophosphatase family protein n=1 Tax=Exiguobacterium oxidotolerans TaxID=223958 RepID=UPI0004940F3D|nr:inositol monophosphatase family protein [Exiguobacterium oxidotolerans]
MQGIELHAIDLMKRAGKYIRQMIDHAYHIEEKTNKSDLVTEIDKNVEDLLIEGILNQYPDHHIYGEEGRAARPETLGGTIWFVDPIDGTMNFIRQKRHFAISIAIMVEGELKYGFVYDVMADEMFHSIKGLGAYENGIRLAPIEEKPVREAIICMNATWVTANRRIDAALLAPLVRDAVGVRAIGAASLELAWVAAGRVDGYITMRNMPWDYAAGQMLIEELGGRVGTIEGDAMTFQEQTSVLAGSRTFIADVLTYVNK